jgi:hypothetical protein
MTTETQFLAPGDLGEDAQATAEAAALLVGPAALIGTWNCCDAATRGLVRVVIAGSGPAITVHVFGACSPTPCDWGVVPGLAYCRPTVSDLGPTGCLSVANVGISLKRRTASARRIKAWSHEA